MSSRQAFIVFGYNLKDEKLVNGARHVLDLALEEKNPAITHRGELLFVGSILGVIPQSDIDLNKLVTVPNGRHREEVATKIQALKETHPSLVAEIEQRNPNVFITWGDEQLKS